MVTILLACWDYTRPRLSAFADLEKLPEIPPFYQQASLQVWDVHYLTRDIAHHFPIPPRVPGTAHTSLHNCFMQ